LHNKKKVAFSSTLFIFLKKERRYGERKVQNNNEQKTIRLFVKYNKIMTKVHFTEVTNFVYNLAN